MKKKSKNIFYDEYLNIKNIPRRSFFDSYNYFARLSSSKKKLLTDQNRLKTLKKIYSLWKY